MARRAGPTVIRARLIMRIKNPRNSDRDARIFYAPLSRRVFRLRNDLRTSRTAHVLSAATKAFINVVRADAIVFKSLVNFVSFETRSAEKVATAAWKAGVEAGSLSAAVTIACVSVEIVDSAAVRAAMRVFKPAIKSICNVTRSLKSLV